MARYSPARKRCLRIFSLLQLHPDWTLQQLANADRGLIRMLFEMIHARSQAEGDLVQAITGVAYFYRQFGYEYATSHALCAACTLRLWSGHPIYPA